MELITQHDEKNMKRFLQLAENPNESATIAEYRGLLYGIAISPILLDPLSWLPFLLGSKPTDFDKIEGMLPAQIDILRHHVDALSDNKLEFSVSCPYYEKGEYPKIVEWLDGFQFALYLAEPYWDIRNCPFELDNEEFYSFFLTFSMIALIGTEYVPGSLTKMWKMQNRPIPKRYKKIFPSLEQLYKEGTLRAYLLDNLPSNIELIRDYGEEIFRYVDEGWELYAENEEDHRKPLVHLRIDIDGAKPPIWRRVELSALSTLGDLHRIIMSIFDWEPDTPHFFAPPENNYYYTAAGTIEDTHELPGTFQDEQTISLVELFSAKGRKMLYSTLDKRWDMKILIEEFIVEEISRNYPVVLRGRRRIPDYESTLDNWQENIKHEKKNDMFLAEDIALCNEKLQKLFAANKN